MSEALEEHTKTALQQYFHCPVVSRYSNRENGILAQQLPGFGNNFLPNEASYRFEVLDLRSDQPVNEGEIGRIVVTDYFNFAMPLIRYDTGDIGVLAKFRTAGKEHIVFSKIEGRRMDAVYDTSGELVSSFIFPNRLRTYREIRQFQFIQTGADSYMFKLCATPDFNSEKKLIDEFRGFLGDNAEISVTYVDEIPLLASGKRKKVVNTFRAVKKK
jgi:phenylacetate-CoA ligase